MTDLLERKFQLNENNTSVKNEVLAGVTSFITMSYILAVNPQILSDAGMDAGGVFTATILATVLACLIVGLFANYPFVLSAGMGVNAFFTYTLVLGMGYTWNQALTVVFFEGIILIILTLLNVRVKIMDAIPQTLRSAITVGIGLYICLIGLTNAGLVVQGEGTILQLGDLTSPSSIVAVFGILLTGILLARGVRAAILIGIGASTILAIILGVTSLPAGLLAAPPSLAGQALSLDFSLVGDLNFWIVVVSLAFSDVLDTAGTLIGLADKGDFLDERGQLPRANRVLVADGLVTVIGSLLGTSTIKIFAENAVGIGQGAKTGLASLAAGLCFLLCLFFYPIFQIIPSAATAPALVIVGLMMVEAIQAIDFSDYTESLPAFLTMVTMPFAYSIVEGIIAGILSYVVIKVLTGKRDQVSPLMYIMAGVFILRIIFL